MSLLPMSISFLVIRSRRWEVMDATTTTSESRSSRTFGVSAPKRASSRSSSQSTAGVGCRSRGGSRENNLPIASALTGTTSGDSGSVSRTASYMVRDFPDLDAPTRTTNRDSGFDSAARNLSSASRRCT